MVNLEKWLKVCYPLAIPLSLFFLRILSKPVLSLLMFGHPNVGSGSFQISILPVTCWLVEFPYVPYKFLYSKISPQIYFHWNTFSKCVRDIKMHFKICTGALFWQRLLEREHFLTDQTGKMGIMHWLCQFLIQECFVFTLTVECIIGLICSHLCSQVDIHSQPRPEHPRGAWGPLPTVRSCRLGSWRGQEEKVAESWWVSVWPLCTKLLWRETFLYSPSSSRLVHNLEFSTVQVNTYKVFLEKLY